MIETMTSEWLSIGEFSKVTGLSVKTLRFYHEQGILLPNCVDESSGYRYYDGAKTERARVIVALREMEFSIQEIAEILSEIEDEADLVARLEEQKRRIGERMRREREIVRALDRVIANEREARELMKAARFEVEEKNMDPMLIAGFRMKGKYTEIGKGFGRLGRAVGGYICGQPLALYYDCEHRDEDADFEPCFPIRKRVEAVEGEGISIRELPGGRCLSLLHKGPYPQLGRSYERILRAARERAADLLLPTREVYLKCPGMILKGNPKNYLTEIQLPVGS
jgi:DNA-binding transcriptional MerR regulator/effector-binding domain-containing protein